MQVLFKTVGGLMWLTVVSIGELLCIWLQRRHRICFLGV